jgi:hypothetical protein
MSEERASDLQRALAEALLDATAESGKGEEEEPPLPTEPTLPRLYETSCVDVPGSGSAMTVISTPMPPMLLAGLHERRLAHLITGTWLVEELELNDVRRIDDADLLVPAVLYTRPDHSPTYHGPMYAAAAEADRERHEYIIKDLPLFAGHVASKDPTLLLFAARMTYEPVIPIEESPLSCTSLAKLFGSTTTSVALCKMSGLSDPLILVVTPTMVVVMGASTGLGSGLHEGLRRRMIKWLTGSDPGSSEPDASDDPHSQGTLREPE